MREAGDGDCVVELLCVAMCVVLSRVRLVYGSVECGCLRKDKSCNCEWCGEQERVVGDGDAAYSMKCGGCSEGGSCCVDASEAREVWSYGGVLVMLCAARRKMVVAISSMDLWVDDNQATPSRRIMASASLTS